MKFILPIGMERRREWGNRGDIKTHFATSDHPLIVFEA